MKNISKEESELFYSSLPEEISNIFRQKIKLVYVEGQTIVWKSSVDSDEKIILSKHSTSIKNQLRILFNCGDIKNLSQSAEEVSFLIDALKLLQVKEIKIS